MIQKLDLNENLINKINYSLSFSLNNEILSVERVSYEPLWRKNSFYRIVCHPYHLFFIDNIVLYLCYHCRCAVCEPLLGGTSFSDSYHSHLFNSNTIYKFFVFQ